MRGTIFDQHGQMNTMDILKRGRFIQGIYDPRKNIRRNRGHTDIARVCIVQYAL